MNKQTRNVLTAIFAAVILGPVIYNVATSVNNAPPPVSHDQMMVEVNARIACPTLRFVSDLSISEIAKLDADAKAEGMTIGDLMARQNANRLAKCRADRMN
jgi:hypothetical protein